MSTQSRRPAPRRSSLSGANPAMPAEAGAPASTEPDSAQRAAPAEEEGKRKYRHKVSFYQDTEDTARMRGALLGTMPYEGSRSQSKFISDVVMAEVERLEAKYNGGKPFKPVGPKELPQGRPMGE